MLNMCYYDIMICMNLNIYVYKNCFWFVYFDYNQYYFFEIDCLFVVILIFFFQFYICVCFLVGINYFFIGKGIESVYIEENIIYLEVYSFLLLLYFVWVYILYISMDVVSV